MRTSVTRFDGDEIFYRFLSCVLDESAVERQKTVAAVVEQFYKTIGVPSSSTIESIWCASGLTTNQPTARFCIKSLTPTNAHA